eukprot:CAMPEP_0206500788 /NCGR_PEP_ID=MMETSP0324_2-20121206/52857_1 /ASSEMBLY_ACC=CAM_ASM_000836 /TAXON_ID=2866 /ORGANISM="Crypthecodinium cohnii, Strain Seligo" /LENGTH=95 /DNA_ID=CAMNT_0053988351 /DNA_START=219 /DNA_END=506 /DNA_ORIENTATION=+
MQLHPSDSLHISSPHRGDFEKVGAQDSTDTPDSASCSTTTPVESSLSSAAIAAFSARLCANFFFACFTCLRRRFSMGGQRWQNSQSYPVLQPSSL